MAHEIPDNAPAVSVAIEYGQHIDSLDVDIRGLTEYLEDRGVTDDDIEHLHIHFSGESGGSGRYIKNGVYDQPQDEISMYSLQHLRKASRTGYRAFDSYIAKMVNRTFVHELEHKIAMSDPELQESEQKYMKSLMHKKIARAIGTYAVSAGGGVGLITVPAVSEVLSKPEVYDFHPLKLLAVLAITSIAARTADRVGFTDFSHRDYLANPNEKRAREAEDTYEKQFISFKPKYVGHETDERKEFEGILREIVKEVEPAVLTQQ